MTVKEFWKSVFICQSYDQKSFMRHNVVEKITSKNNAFTGSIHNNSET